MSVYGQTYCDAVVALMDSCGPVTLQTGAYCNTTVPLLVEVQQCYRVRPNVSPDTLYLFMSLAPRATVPIDSGASANIQS